MASMRDRRRGGKPGRTSKATRSREHLAGDGRALQGVRRSAGRCTQRPCLRDRRRPSSSSCYRGHEMTRPRRPLPTRTRRISSRGARGLPGQVPRGRRRNASSRTLTGAQRSGRSCPTTRSTRTSPARSSSSSPPTPTFSPLYRRVHHKVRLRGVTAPVRPSRRDSSRLTGPRAARGAAGPSRRQLRGGDPRSVAHVQSCSRIAGTREIGTGPRGEGASRPAVARAATRRPRTRR